MAELTISQLIKIILGVLVFVVIFVALYFFFRDQVISFFKGFGGNSTGGVFLSLLK